MSVAVSVMGVLPCVPSGDAHRGVSARGTARVTRHSRRGVPASRYVWASECHIWGRRGRTPGCPECCFRSPKRADSRGLKRTFAVLNVPTRAGWGAHSRCRTCRLAGLRPVGELLQAAAGAGGADGRRGRTAGRVAGGGGGGAEGLQGGLLLVAGGV